MNLRCLFGVHATALVATGDQGVIRCTRCSAVLESWPLLRPEARVQAEKTHAEIMADREKRAQAMSTPSRPKVVRMR